MLVVLLIGGVVAGVIISNSGSKSSNCPGEGAGTSSAQASEHCKHGDTAVADQGSGSGGTIGAPEGRGASGATGTDGSHAARGVAGSSAAAADAGSAAGGSGSGGGQANGNGGTAAGGAAGSGTAAGGSGAPGASDGAGTPNASHQTAGAVVLASGQSETGIWSATSKLPTELEPTLTTATIVFPIPLPEVLYEGQAVYVNETEAKKPGSSRSAAIKAACGESGTVAAPTAKPGHLCVYSAQEDFTDRTPSGGVPTHNVHGAIVPFKDGEYVAIINHRDTERVDRTGARVAFGVPDIRTEEEERANAFPHIAAHGSWAVTGQ